MKIFLDANIIFTAAHNPSGKSAFIIRLAKEGHFKCITCEFAMIEAERNLTSKFPEALAELQRLKSHIQLIKTTTGLDCPIDLNSKDRPIFLSCLQSGASHLLTGDKKDFGHLMNKKDITLGILIQTPSDFLSSKWG